jgi:glycosyltransferase involved in cell wall biosynthesis
MFNNAKINENAKIKVIFITGRLQRYRIPIFEEIVKITGWELTVAHSSGKIYHGDKFSELLISEKKIGPFIFHVDNLGEIFKKYHVVVAMFYLLRISIMVKMLIRSGSYKRIMWGIGVRASQNTKYDSWSPMNYLRYAIAHFVEAVIFYSDYPITQYKKWGVSCSKLFVMNNTVSVDPRFHISFEEKNCLTFLGTLKKSKKIYELLEQYKIASKNENVLPLHIIGGGDVDEIKKWIFKFGLEDKIKVHGEIFDEARLAAIMTKSVACISPGQAGLSVLKSFGYGSIFITNRNAITGGEIFNIINKNNGLLYRDKNELSEIINDISNNKQDYIKMGVNAYKHYWNKRTPNLMAKGFISAVEYAISKK